MEGWLWIVAGHNGAGKTTLARELFGSLIEGATHINADDITANLVAQGHPATDATNLEAARIADSMLDHCIRERQTCVVETVLSSEKHKHRIHSAKARGMSVGLIYVVLSSEDLAVERVALRHESGGHDVPEDKIRSRRQRSIESLPWFASRADAVFVYCNDDPHPGSPMLIASKRSGKLELHAPGVVPEIDHVLESLL